MTTPSTVFKNVSGFQFGFGNAHHPIPLDLEGIWNEKGHRHEQVHGTHLTQVLEPRQEIGDADGIFSTNASLPVGVRTADCVPILIAHQEKQAICAVHAGWRGTYENIVLSTWKTLSSIDNNASNWIAVIGPAIQPCCYEVSPELCDKFLTHFKEIPEQITSPKKNCLDLQHLNRKLLLTLGFFEVEIIDHCTYCHQTNGSPTYFSYRRNQSTGRQYSIISRLF